MFLAQLSIVILSVAFLGCDKDITLISVCGRVLIDGTVIEIRGTARHNIGSDEFTLMTDHVERLRTGRMTMSEMHVDVDRDTETIAIKEIFKEEHALEFFEGSHQPVIVTFRRTNFPYNRLQEANETLVRVKVARGESEYFPVSLKRCR